MAAVLFRDFGRDGCRDFRVFKQTSLENQAPFTMVACSYLISTVDLHSRFCDELRLAAVNPQLHSMHTILLQASACKPLATALLHAVEIGRRCCAGAERGHAMWVER